MADWVTIGSLATAGGTLVLAVSTFAAVHSANRSNRVTERALLAGIRPVLVPSRFDAPVEKVGFIDEHWVKVPGGRATVEVTDDAVYLVASIRNVGSGLAVLDRWDFQATRRPGESPEHRDLSTFRRLTRDLYVPAGDTGFWQGAFRDKEEPIFAEVVAAIEARQAMTLDLLYGDHEGGQRTITRFALLPAAEGEPWILSASRHWNLDRDDPR